MQTPSTTADYFEVVSHSGQVRTRQRLDYEQLKRFNLVIIARDQAVAPQQQQQSTLQLHIFLQDVNDNSPMFQESLYSFSIVESIPTNTNFGQVTATDNDNGGHAPIIYVLGSHADIFGINPTTGHLYSRTPLINVNEELYNVQVIAVDDGMRSAVTMVTIAIRDGSYNLPVFTQEHYRYVCGFSYTSSRFWKELFAYFLFFSFTLLESESEGSVVGHVSATHHSSTVGLRYSIEENNVPFLITKQGLITNTRPLNRENTAGYDFNVRATTEIDEAYTAIIGVHVQV